MMPETSVKRSTKFCRIMYLHRSVDWLAKSLSTCWRLIWSFASGTACLNNVCQGDRPTRDWSLRYQLAQVGWRLRPNRGFPLDFAREHHPLNSRSEAESWKG